MYIYTRTVQKWLPTSICLQKEQISYKREIWLKLYKKTKNNNYTFLNRFSGRLKGVVQFLWSHWNSESLWNRLWKSGRFSLGKQQDIKVNLFFLFANFGRGVEGLVSVSPLRRYTLSICPGDHCEGKSQNFE